MKMIQKYNKKQSNEACYKWHHYRKKYCFILPEINRFFLIEKETKMLRSIKFSYEMKEWMNLEINLPPGWLIFMVCWSFINVWTMLAILRFPTSYDSHLLLSQTSVVFDVKRLNTITSYSLLLFKVWRPCGLKLWK